MRLFLSITFLLALNSLLTAQVPALIKGSRGAAEAIGRMGAAEMDRRARMTPEEQAALAKQERDRRDASDLNEARKCPFMEYRKWTIGAKRRGFSLDNPHMPPCGPEGEDLYKLEGGKSIAAKPVLLSKDYVWLKPKNEKDGKEPIKIMRVHLPNNENRILELIDRRLDNRESPKKSISNER